MSYLRKYMNKNGVDLDLMLMVKGIDPDQVEAMAKKAIESDKILVVSEDPDELDKINLTIV